jgi:hypothetical protein
MTSDADSRVILANSIDLLAQAIDRLADARTAAPGQPGPPSGPPSAPPAGNGREKTTQEKMAAKVYALCKQNNWDMADAMTRATGRDMGADSRKLSEADLGAVLDGFKGWGVG